MLPLRIIRKNNSRLNGNFILMLEILVWWSNDVNSLSNEGVIGDLY